MLHVCLEGVPRVSISCPEGVSMMFNGVSMVFQGCYNGVSGELQWFFKNVLWLFQGLLDGVSRVS